VLEEFRLARASGARHVEMATRCGSFRASHTNRAKQGSVEYYMLVTGKRMAGLAQGNTNHRTFPSPMKGGNKGGAYNKTRVR
jgi:hypothetical protein